MLRIERSNPRDVERLCHFDPMARRDAARRVMLMSWARQGQVEIGLVGDSIVGFAVLTHSFFHQPFIELLMIGETYRRQGYGRALVEHCVAAVPVGVKLWTSTNESNASMRALLAVAGFIASGRVDNLDPGDPELIFVHLPGA